MLLRAYVREIYTRSGQITRETVMKLSDISDAATSDQLSPGMSVVLNKHGKQKGVSEGDHIEFEADVSAHNGKTYITHPRHFRRISNY